MEGLFSHAGFEHPISFDAFASGEIAVLDRDGHRLLLYRSDEGAHRAPGAFNALHCRCRDGQILLLGRDGLLRRIRMDGSPVGEVSARAGAANLAVDKAGNIVVSYGRAGVAEHGAILERFGPQPASYADPDLRDATSLACESGGIWIGGTGVPAPAARMVMVRPTAEGFARHLTVGLKAPPRSAAVGPDGALYVLSEPGEKLVRAFGEETTAEHDLDEPLTEIGRVATRLIGCGPRGFCDLTEFVPRP
jgi:hypothetical protein